MRIGSLFSGIGGLELGLERAGVGHTVWQVEQNEWCRGVLAKHWPDAARYEDVTTMDWSTVEPVEVLCGGFPCQDLSFAGKGAGLDGARSGLWWEYARAVRVLRPRFVVVENVAALLVRGMGDVLGELAACGYDCEWDCVPAVAVGAPHRRDRVFIIAYADGGRCGGVGDDGGDGGTVPGERLERVVRGSSSSESAVADTEGQPVGPGLRQGEPAGFGRGRPGDGGSPQGDVADTDSEARGEPWSGPSPLERSGRRGSSPWDPWAVEPDVGRVAHGVPARVDRLKGLGNAVVPQVAEVVGRRLMALREMEATR